MKNQLMFLALWLLLANGFGGLAQVTPGIAVDMTCLSGQMYDHLIVIDSSYTQRNQQFDSKVALYLSQPRITPVQPRTIAVYVHVVHLPGDSVGSATNISVNKIYQQISILNNRFNGLHLAGYSISFNWNPADIERVPSSLSGTFSVANEASLKNIAPAFEPETHLNIWICDMAPTNGGGTLTGYAHYPLDIGPPISNGPISPNWDGIVVDFQVFGNSNAYIGWLQGNTAIHEVGHYLGLFHIWGPNNTGYGNCSVDDQIDDTPRTCDPIYGTPPVNNNLACLSNTSPLSICSGDSADVQNYMEYTDPDYHTHFTPQQLTRMGTVLNNERYCLMEPAVCTTTAPIAIFPILLNAMVGDTIIFQDASINNPTSWRWHFGGAVPSTSQQQNPSVVFMQAGIQRVTLIVSNIGGADTLTKSINVLNILPVIPKASFALPVNLILKDSMLSVFDESTGNLTSWQWEITGPEHKISNAQNPIFRFGTVGKYNLRLTVNGLGGSDDTLLRNAITVSFNETPIASFAVSDSVICTGQQMEIIDQSQFTDTSITIYHWQISGPNGLLQLVSGTQYPVVAFSQPGSYSVFLRISNPLSANGLSSGSYISAGAFTVRHAPVPLLQVKPACYNRKNAAVRVTIPPNYYNANRNYYLVLKSGRIFGFQNDLLFFSGLKAYGQVKGVRVYEGLCISNPFSVNVPMLDSIKLNVLQVVDADSGIANGSVTISISGGVAPYYLNNTQSGYALSQGVHYFGGLNGPQVADYLFYDSYGCPSNQVIVSVGINSISPVSISNPGNRLSGSLAATPAFAEGPETLPADAELLLFPNPAHQQAALRLTLTEEHQQVATVLFNMAGQQFPVAHVALLTAGVHFININLDEMPPGIYHLVVRANGAAIGHQKLTVF